MPLDALNLDNLLEGLRNLKYYLTKRYGKKSFKVELVEAYKYMPSCSDLVLLVFNVYDECGTFLEHFKVPVA